MEDAVRPDESSAAPLGRSAAGPGPGTNPEAKPGANPGANPVPTAVMATNVRAASQFLKALSNHNRLLLLCLLSENELTVTELEAALGLRQPAISQQLARLRAAGLVIGRRNGKSIHYRLASEEARRVMELLCELFCEPAQDRTRAEDGNGPAPCRAV